MKQRVAGVAMLMTVALCVVIVPGALGKPVSGLATVASVPEAPGYGDCISRPIDQAQRVDFTLGAGIPITMPSAMFGPCTGWIYGEVASVYVTAPGQQSTLSEHLRGVDHCAQDGHDYLGVPVALNNSAVHGDTRVNWEPEIGLAVVAVGPTARERAGGRSWAACLVEPAVAAPYRGTARSSLVNHGLPWDLHTCWVGAPQEPLISCKDTHGSQLIGTSVVPVASPLTASDLQRSCTDFASAMLGATDPTAKGSLVLLGVRDPSMPVDLTCSLTATGARSLTASVISLGDKSPPFGA